LQSLKAETFETLHPDENRYLLAHTQGEVQDEPENGIKPRIKGLKAYLPAKTLQLSG
jgi:hypothetical protein